MKTHRCVPAMLALFVIGLSGLFGDAQAQTPSLKTKRRAGKKVNKIKPRLKPKVNRGFMSKTQVTTFTGADPSKVRSSFVLHPSKWIYTLGTSSVKMSLEGGSVFNVGLAHKHNLTMSSSTHKDGNRTIKKSSRLMFQLTGPVKSQGLLVECQVAGGSTTNALKVPGGTVQVNAQKNGVITFFRYGTGKEILTIELDAPGTTGGRSVLFRQCKFTPLAD